MDNGKPEDLSLAKNPGCSLNLPSVSALFESSAEALLMESVQMG